MAWDLGDTVPLTTEITDSNGDLVAAAGVVCTVGLPDGTSVTPAVSNPSTGRFTVDYVATMAGRHTERWTSTSPATARSDTFDVRPAAPAYIVSLADAKKHLNKAAGSTIDDEELRPFIEAATEVVEDLAGEAVIRRTVVERVTIRGSRLALTSVPVVSLTSMVSLDGAQTFDVAAWDVDPASGIISALPGATACGQVVVTYVAGYQVIPARYTQAALMILRHQWDSQRGGTGGTRRSPLGGAAEDSFVYSGGYAIPRAAAELIGPAIPGVA